MNIQVYFDHLTCLYDWLYVLKKNTKKFKLQVTGLLNSQILDWRLFGRKFYVVILEVHLSTDSRAAYTYTLSYFKFMHWQIRPLYFILFYFHIGYIVLKFNRTYEYER